MNQNQILLEAMKEYGLTELPGSGNPKIVQMSKDLGYPFNSDKDNWCGIFVATCVTRSGGAIPDKAYSARNWLKWGNPVTEPQTGDIVVFWRVAKDSWQGHVAIFISYADSRKEYVNVLGGNQGNKVCIAPYDAAHILGFRRVSSQV